MKKSISVESMWQTYVNLSLKGVSEDSIQYKESRKVFYAAVGQSILDMRDVLGSAEYTEDEAIAVLKDMIVQVQDLFDKEAKEWDERQKEAPKEQEKPSPADVLIPRFRGNIVPKGSGWGWEGFITIGPHGGKNDPEPIAMESNKTFISREAAGVDLKDHAAKMLKTVCEIMKLPTPTDFMDLNEGMVKPAKAFEKKKK